MHITEYDALPSRILEGLVPHISLYLFKAQNELDIQLQELEGIVIEKNHILFQQAASEDPKLIAEFLRVLKEYLDSTLKDFFRFIEHISVLMEDYDQTLEMFLEDTDTTLQNVQRCIEVVGTLVECHGETIRDLSVTSGMTNDLMRRYHSKVDCAPEVSFRDQVSRFLQLDGSQKRNEILVLSETQTKDVSQKQTETGPQTTTVIKTVTVTRMMKKDQTITRTLTQTETATETKKESHIETGTVTETVQEDRIETMTVPETVKEDLIEYPDCQLNIIQVANNEFPTLVHLIFNKLEGCNNFLGDPREFLCEQGVPGAISMDVYANAQEEAKRIVKCCKEISGGDRGNLEHQVVCVNVFERIRFRYNKGILKLAYGLV